MSLDGADDLVDQTGLLGLLRAERRALQQDAHQRVLDAEQAHGTNHAAAAGEQAEGDLGGRSCCP